MLTIEKYAGALPPGSHGSTFGGNPLASAAALAVLKIIDDEKLVAGAKEKGEALGRMLGRPREDDPNRLRERAWRRTALGPRSEAGLRRA